MTPGVANGQSEIKLDRLEFHRPDSVANQYGPDEGWTGLIQAVLFEVNDRDKIGYPTAQGYRYCCVKELVPKTKCHLDRLIYQVCSLFHTFLLYATLASIFVFWREQTHGNCNFVPTLHLRHFSFMHKQILSNCVTLPLLPQ